MTCSLQQLLVGPVERTVGRVGGGEVCREGMWGVKGCVGGGEKSEIGGVKKWRVEGSEGVRGKEREEVCDSGGVYGKDGERVE